MKAAVIEKQGGIENIVYREFADPVVGPRDVLVRCKAVGLNYFDIFVRRGMPGLPVPMPWISGADAAGEIAAIGSEVQGWKVGDRCLIDPLTNEGMMGEEVQGAFAEYCRIPQDFVIPLDPRLSFVEAATIPANYGTVYRMLFTNGGMQPDDLVLVLGASGGVGTGCVLLAKMLGAEVIACASSTDKIQRLKDLGADHVINYKDTDFSKWVIEKFGKPQRRNYEGGVDVVINFTGGDTWAPTLKCVKRGGKILVCGATAGFDPKEDLRYIWSFELKVIGSNSFYDENLKALMDLIVQGKMKPVIDEVLPLAQAAHGLKLIEDREVFGKVIVCP